jgi:glyoxylase-like metal-dependent hydrolase (beta-lactamase superfamily II)
MNYQAGRRLGVNVYLIDGGSEFLLIDIGYDDTVDELVDLIRRMDFNLSSCKMIIATHADADHIQGIARARDLLKTKIAAHPLAQEPLETGDEILTFATIKAQNFSIPMPRCKVDVLLNEGDTITVGDLALDVWHTPGHTAGQLAFKMGNLLFSGDNIYKDSCVGAIDAHHGSDLPEFLGVARPHHPGRRRVPAAEPRPRLPPRQPDRAEGDRPADAVPAHGRLRHVRRRLAAAGRVGRRGLRRPLPDFSKK